MQLTYFFDVCSVWCALGDETIAEVGARYVPERTSLGKLR